MKKYDDEDFRNRHPHFYPGLQEKCPALTDTQLLICAMIRDNFLSHEIASTRKTSERTVESHRRNIRKKLGLKKANYRIPPIDLTVRVSYVGVLYVRVLCVTDFFSTMLSLYRDDRANAPSISLTISIN